MSLLVISEILGFFVNTMTVNDKYHLLNRCNLPQPIWMKLFKKQKTISEFFLKSAANFEYLEEKDDPHRFCISKITDWERREMSKNPRFRTRFGSQHAKGC